MTADGRLGLCDVLPGNAPTGVPWTQLATNAGAGVNRWELRWDRIERTRGAWNFVPDDAAVSASVNAGLEVQGILIGTPGWAAASGQKPGNGVPAGLYLDPSNPKNLWATYVRATVTHFRTQIRDWEIWNEPDLSFFWMGTPADYVRLMVVANSVIQSIDPGATVLMAGMVDPSLRFPRAVLAGITDAAPFNAVAWHAYGPARSAYSNISALHGLLAQKGLGSLPIWVNESGFPASNPTGEPRQAAYVLQTIVYAFAAGASRVLVYRASDDPLPKTFGLVSAAGVPRMGYLAFQVAASQLSNIGALTYLPGSSIERFQAYEGNRLVTILWNRGASDTQADVTALGPAAQAVDWQGSVTSLTAVNGVYHLTLPGASYNVSVDDANNVVGGSPVMLIQDNLPLAAPALSGYIGSLTGKHRRIAVLNHGAAPATVQIAATSRHNIRQTLTVAPDTLQMLDLDLFAGLGYSGGYTVTATSPVTAVAGSDTAAAGAALATKKWFVASTAQPLSLTNPGTADAKVSITTYRVPGGTVTSADLSVPAGNVIQWKPATKVSMIVKAQSPLVVQGAGVTPSLGSSWYAVKPASTHLALFNPHGTAADVDVQFIGSSTVTGQQLHLLPRRAYSLNTHEASALVVTSDQSIAAGYGHDTPSGAVVSAPTTESALASAGSQTNMSLFNPSTLPAHISYSIVTRGTTTLKTITVAPSSVKTVQARKAGDPPRGIIVRSDVPVVAQTNN